VASVPATRSVPVAPAGGLELTVAPGTGVVGVALADVVGLAVGVEPAVGVVLEVVGPAGLGLALSSGEHAASGSAASPARTARRLTATVQSRGTSASSDHSQA
jgi:hypothetical protein